ncbi:aldehyde dehydrogenase [Empedobacter brevis NBRC 14943 = ATCC 43319]|uniref:Aldehyde dehydrogenase n=1 Tax=Empedobacter brevis NBRC 14943 = ATCC 43319 TaxID=1218108 RepID=A0A511NCV5_9FLAO|nr:aldehyde dehydrogenase family protein [Empedobacter brevis]GEM50643.1 aldehyde dehydrogenase [Empedobacter brevis NBRC 14943 = ATCC 43319]
MSDFKTTINEIYDLQFKNKLNIRNLSVHQRKEYLLRLEKSILKHRSEIEQALFLDLRKSKVEADSTEIFPVLSEIRLFRRKLNRWSKTKSVSNNLIFFGSKAQIQPESLGNCLIISPWNYPFQLCLLHLVACISAGNTAILKPSEFTPATSEILSKIIGEVFERDHVAIVEGEVEQTTYLLSKKFDHIHFTGSPKVGKIVMEAGAKNLSSVTLELGGKSPLIIDETIPIQEVVEKAIWGKLINFGQTCIAPDYILIKEEFKDQFVTAFIQHLEKIVGKDPSQSKDLARIVNLQNYKRLKIIIEDAIEKGAKCPFGNEYREDELYIKPTLLTDISKDAVIENEEIFGPVFPIYTFKEVNEVIEFIRLKEKPLAIYIFSSNKSFRNKIERQTSSGSVVVNETLVHILHPNLPFGGVNYSGIGASTGYAGFVDFSHLKPILNVNRIFSPSKFLNYPYNSTTQKIIDYLMKYF